MRSCLEDVILVRRSQSVRYFKHHTTEQRTLQVRPQRRHIPSFSFRWDSRRRRHPSLFRPQVCDALPSKSARSAFAFLSVPRRYTRQPRTHSRRSRCLSTPIRGPPQLTEEASLYSCKKGLLVRGHRDRLETKQSACFFFFSFLRSQSSLSPVLGASRVTCSASGDEVLPACSRGSFA